MQVISPRGVLLLFFVKTYCLRTWNACSSFFQMSTQYALTSKFREYLTYEVQFSVHRSGVKPNVQNSLARTRTKETKSELLKKGDSVRNSFKEAASRKLISTSPIDVWVLPLVESLLRTCNLLLRQRAMNYDTTKLSW